MSLFQLSKIGNNYDQYSLHDIKGKTLAILTDTTPLQSKQIEIAPEMFEALRLLAKARRESTQEMNNISYTDAVQSIFDKIDEIYNEELSSALPF